ncbi:MAG: bifunctional metallophosphatase/5'-nucleotidase [Prevotella sp.]
MRRIGLFVFAMLLSIVAYAQKQIVILHTNDTHSQIVPVPRYENEGNTSCRGGFVRRVAVVNEERKKEPDLLLFDSGDFSQGSTYYTLFRGEVEVGLMNMMGYDAATLGNHEFDFGIENLARVAKMAKFPLVCANCDFTGTMCEGLIKPYVIIKRKGLKIGVFGLAPKIQGLVMQQNIQGVKYLDPYTTANEIARKLKEDEKCDLVVCLSHLGWDLKPRPDDAQLIAATRNIDIVLGGHSHTYMEHLEWVNNIDGKPVPTEQNGRLGAYVGRIVMKLQK